MTLKRTTADFLFYMPGQDGMGSCMSPVERGRWGMHMTNWGIYTHSKKKPGLFIAVNVLQDQKAFGSEINMASLLFVQFMLSQSLANTSQQSQAA